MFFSYFDETGDDGYPGSSSLFVLTSIYFTENIWKDIYQSTFEFRKKLKTVWGIPIRMELHTKNFVANKKPYYNFLKDMPLPNRFLILKEYAEFISSLPIKVINICINKNKLQTKNSRSIIDLALTFNIQRIENDLLADQNKFLIITDRGRLAAMRFVTRKIQAINYVPSKFDTTSYSKPIKLMLEDPLEKESTQSYFIQFADFISFVVYHQLMKELVSNEHSRKIEEFGYENIETLFHIVKKVFNLKACATRGEDGIFVYPK